jgi:hypothetical protein
MEDVAKMAYLTLKPTGTGIIFCSFDQFPVWKFILREQGFCVNKMPLCFLPGPGPVPCARNNGCLVNILQIAVVFHKSWTNYYFNKSVSDFDLFFFLF